MAQAYLQFRHAANELVRNLHIRVAGIVERDKLGGKVLVAIEEPGVGTETTRRSGRWVCVALSLLSHSCSCLLYTERC